MATLKPVEDGYRCVLPSPTAHSSICDSDDDLLVYGANRYIVAVNFKLKPFGLNVYEAHRKKIICLKLRKIKKLLVSVGEPNRIKVWDVSADVKNIFTLSQMKDVIYADWSSHPSEDVVFIAYGRNTIRRWNITGEKNFTDSKCGTSEISVIASHPINSDLLAVGFQTSEILIYDVANCIVEKRLEEYNNAVLSIMWSPEANQLLSISSGFTFHVWSLDTMKCEIHQLKLKVRKQSRIPAIWHPVKSNVILFFDPSCFLSEFDMNEESGDDGSSVLVKHKISIREMRNNNSQIHSIVRYGANKIVTFSTDRMITLWNLESCSIEVDIMTAAYFVRHLEFAPLNSGLCGTMAVASDDKHLALWDIHAPVNTQHTRILNNGIFGLMKLTAWHPHKDIIAFATKEPQHVGFIPNCTENEPVVTFDVEFTSLVSSLTWAPCPKLAEASSTTDLFLYACGSGKIFVFNADDPKSSVDFDTLIGSNAGSKKNYYHIAWKSDFTLFAVVDSDNCVNIYDGNSFELLVVLKVRHKKVFCIQWSPSSLLSLLGSPDSLPNYLALGIESQINNLCVYNMEKILGAKDTESISTFTKFLMGHSAPVSCMAWNPHVAKQIASASHDCTVQVWDVESELCLAKFHGHHEKIQCVTWNIFDPDVIFSGGGDRCILSWKISDQHVTSFNQAEQEDAGTKVEKARKKEVDIGNCHQPVKGRIGGLQKYLPQMEATEEVENSSSGLDQANQEGATLKFMNKIFSKPDAQVIQMLKGDCDTLLTEGLNKSAEEKTLRPHDLALARIVSQSMWLKMCEKFSIQEKAKDHIRKAVLFFLACHKIQEAIDMLVDEQCYSMAYLVAKIYFPEDAPILSELLRNQQDKDLDAGNFEISAVCSLLLNEPLVAAEALSKRCKVQHMFAAMDICISHGLVDEAKEYSLLSVIHGLVEHEWSLVRNLVQEKPYLQTLSWVITVHESFLKEDDKLRGSDHQFGQLIFSNKCSPSEVIWKGYNVNGQNFLSSLLDSMIGKNQLNPNLPNFQEEFSTLKSFIKSCKIDTTLKGILFMLAMDICDFIFILLSEVENKFEIAFKSIAKAVRFCASFEEMDMIFADIMDAFCILTLPFDILGDENDSTVQIAYNLRLNEPKNIIDDAYNWLMRNASKESIIENGAISITVQKVLKPKSELWPELQNQKFVLEDIREEIFRLSVSNLSVQLMEEL